MVKLIIILITSCPHIAIGIYCLWYLTLMSMPKERKTWLNVVGFVEFLVIFNYVIFRQCISLENKQHGCVLCHCDNQNMRYAWWYHTSELDKFTTVMICRFSALINTILNFERKFVIEDKVFWCANPVWLTGPFTPAVLSPCSPVKFDISDTAGCYLGPHPIILT